MHEVLTVQIGSQSNYVGTHFWNAQESYFTYAGQEESPVDHDIHFRQGIGPSGSDTFTPRTLIYDFKGNFGSLRRINELYEEVEEEHANQNDVWNRSTATQREAAIEPNAYQRSLAEGNEPSEIQSSDVRFWSDFNRVFYHPRSCVQVYETELDPGQRAFKDWSSGEELFASLSREEDLLDRDLRPFAEECDQMQGLQMLADISDGWAGFASKYMDRLRDEYGKLPIWVAGLEAPSENTVAIRTARIVNQARALNQICQQSSLYVPLTSAPKNLPPYISMDKSHPWHVSAVQASAWESILLPTRLKASQQWDTTSLDHLAILLNGEDDHKIAQLSLNVGETVRSVEHTNGGSHTSGPETSQDSKALPCHLFPIHDTRVPADREPYTFAAAEVDRGRVQGGLDVRNDGGDDEATETRRLARLSCTVRMPLPSSFPRIFSTRDRHTSSVPARAKLSVSSAIGPWVKSIENGAVMRVAYDEREELRHGLRVIGEAYAWAGNSSSDEEGFDD